MIVSVRPELPTAGRLLVRVMRPNRPAVDNSAPSLNRMESTYKSGFVVQTTEATSWLRFKE